MLLGEDANYLDFSNSPVRQEGKNESHGSLLLPLAMACFYSMFGAISICIIIQPNLSTLGAHDIPSPL